MALIEAAYDREPAAREVIQEALFNIGKKQPVLLLSSCEAYLCKHKRVSRAGLGLPLCRLVVPLGFAIPLPSVFLFFSVVVLGLFPLSFYPATFSLLLCVSQCPHVSPSSSPCLQLVQSHRIVLLKSMESVVRVVSDDIPPELAIRLVRVALMEMCTKQVRHVHLLRIRHVRC